MTVTLPPAALPPAAWRRDAAAPFAARLRRLLAGGGAGQAALRLAPAAPRRRRALRLLLEEAAREGRGEVLEAPGGALLLLGEAGAAARARALLDEVGLDAAGALWRLPEEAPALLAWAEAAPPPDLAAAPLAGLDAALQRLPLPRLLRRRAVLRLGPGRPPRVALRRLVLSRAALAAALGSPGEDPDLLDHAADTLARRLAAAPSLPAGPGTLLPLPRGGTVPPAPAEGTLGALPLEALAAPDMPARLAAAGWTPAIEGLDAVALRLLSPAALPEGAPLLLLRWSPALADRGPVQALRALDPGRLVLLGCGGAEAIAWGLARGIGLFAGPAVEALLPPGEAEGAA
ncbi:hypothetical protein [Crenalkalicoccus roseus]|uniref:hypothetical protein n=1 Tax=Crenalkalicoccus roseus TaxID=1485588 RepID=UPI0010813A27|nr:hypothetical protein [Crenalkalicoccus roseus]